MEFQSPRVILHLLWLLPGLLMLAAWAGLRRRRRLARLAADPTLRERLASTASTSRRHWRFGLLMAAVVCLLLAAARPTLGETVVERPTKSRDILLLIDCSRSMLARDLPPNRLRHARMLSQRLIDAFPEDRFGIVAFAGDASLVCPLTDNEESLQLYLQQLDTDAIPVGGTNIAAALETAEAAFRSGAGEHRAIVVMSDGGSHSGDPSEVLAELAMSQVNVHVIGVGDVGSAAYVQLADGSFLTDADGNRVRADLEEASLQQLARDGGGVYSRTTVMDDGLGPATGRIEQLLPLETRSSSVTLPIERYQIPLAVALLLLFVRLLIGERQAAVERRPRIASDAAMAVVIGFGLLLGPGAVAQDSSDDLDSLEAPIRTPPTSQSPEPGASDDELEVDYLIAELVEIERIADPVARQYERYPLARRLQELDKPEEARRAYQQIVRHAASPDPLRAASYQNIGVILHQQARGQAQSQDLPGAIGTIDQAGAHYREALRLQPTDPALARNYELYLRDRDAWRRQQELQEQMQQAAQQAQQQSEQAQQQQQQSADQSQSDPQQAGQQQQQAEQSAANASDAAQRLEDLAKQAGDQQKQQQAEAAQHELQAAQDAQQRANDSADPAEKQRQRQQAADHLKNASEQLAEAAGQGDDSQQDQDDAGQGQQSDQDQQMANQDDQQSGEGQDGSQGQQANQQDQGQDGQDGAENMQVGQPQQGGQEGQQGQNSQAITLRQVDAMQAERILNSMRVEERDLMEAMQESRRPATPDNGKNW